MADKTPFGITESDLERLSPVSRAGRAKIEANFRFLMSQKNKIDSARKRKDDFLSRLQSDRTQKITNDKFQNLIEEQFGLKDPREFDILVRSGISNTRELIKARGFQEEARILARLAKREDGTIVSPGLPIDQRIRKFNKSARKRFGQRKSTPAELEFLFNNAARDQDEAASENLKNDIVKFRGF